MTAPPQLWIALANVGARDAFSPITGIGAYVNVVGPASDRAAFEAATRRAADAIHLDLLELEDVEPLESRTAEYRVDPDILALAAEAVKIGGVMFGTCHNYPATDG